MITTRSSIPATRGEYLDVDIFVYLDIYVDLCLQAGVQLAAVPGPLQRAGAGAPVLAPVRHGHHHPARHARGILHEVHTHTTRRVGDV